MVEKRNCIFRAPVYSVLMKIDSAGTYGTVFKAKNRETHEIVALKRVRLDEDDEVSVKKFSRAFESLLACFSHKNTIGRVSRHRLFEKFASSKS